MAYSDVQNLVTALLNRRDATTTQIQAFIQNAITRSQRELRVPAMEKSIQVTVGAPWVGLPIPTDFLELINLIPQVDVFDQERLTKTDLTRAIQASGEPGCPEIYARQGGLWILGPSPALGAIIQIDYYAEFAPLVAPTDTNILITIAEDLVQYGALSYAADFFVDKRGTTWEGRYNQILTDLNDMAEQDEEAGAACVQAAYPIPNDFGYVGPFDWVP